ncbi:hypothetical protein [Kutzneria chonburiensis]|uniref:GerMN domain-containing protein n=1 Tax=Kutzneria chonburiensis TaxID=1483604 RepID=A0ABV6MVB7_9PSEU|nr:hypothetical protein [Kutzneria chonburiensis]
MTRRNGLLSTVSLILTGAIVGLVVVGCGIRPTAVIYGQSAPRGAVTSMILYLLDHGKLHAVARPLPAPVTIDGPSGKIMPFVPAESQALDALLKGPSATEVAGGLTSDIPSGAFGSVERGFDGLTIPVFIKTDRGVSLSQHAVDQIACTVITAQLTDGALETTNLKVMVYDSGDQQRTPQNCPVSTP